MAIKMKRREFAKKAIVFLMGCVCVKGLDLSSKTINWNPQTRTLTVSGGTIGNPVNFADIRKAVKKQNIPLDASSTESLFNGEVNLALGEAVVNI